MRILNLLFRFREWRRQLRRVVAVFAPPCQELPTRAAELSPKGKTRTRKSNGYQQCCVTPHAKAARSHARSPRAEPHVVFGRDRRAQQVGELAPQSPPLGRDDQRTQARHGQIVHTAIQPEQRGQDSTTTPTGGRATRAPPARPPTPGCSSTISGGDRRARLKHERVEQDARDLAMRVCIGQSTFHGERAVVREHDEREHTRAHRVGISGLTRTAVDETAISSRRDATRITF